MLTRLSLSVLGLLLCAPAVAGTCSDVGCKGIVERVYTYVQASGLTYVEIAGDKARFNGTNNMCLAYLGAYFGLPGDQPGSKQVLATALAAQATGRELNVRVIAAPDGKCQISYVILEP